MQFEVEEINSSSANDMIGSGNGMMQTRTAYSTAVQVIKRRNLQDVIQRCEVEAAIAGDEFYYSWSQGGKIIEGLTVGAALAIARNFGNCAVDCKVEETPAATIFYGAFIDLETGFNIVRPFRQNNAVAKKKDGSAIYSDERGLDVKFQIGASKAIRNATLNAIPKWLATKVMTKSKENVVGRIEKMGVEKARNMILNKLENLKIPLERVEKSYRKPKGWDIEMLVMLSGALRTIEDGIESVDTIFPDDVVATLQDNGNNGNTNNTGKQPAPNAEDRPVNNNGIPPVESVSVGADPEPAPNVEQPEPALTQPATSESKAPASSNAVDPKMITDQLLREISAIKSNEEFDSFSKRHTKDFVLVPSQTELNRITTALTNKKKELDKKK